MNQDALAAVVRTLELAIFQRDRRGQLRLTGRAPRWLRALWPQATKPPRVLRPAASSFLETFLVDAAACWKAGGVHRISSGVWVERDEHGALHHLQASALTSTGRATLVIGAAMPDYEERPSPAQTAHELSVAFEELQRIEQALAEDKRLLEQRVKERTAELSQANAALQQEIAIRQRLAERLQAMHELDRAILAARSPSAIAEVALRRLDHLLPCDHASLVELDTDHRRATLLASVQEGKTTSDGDWTLSREQRKATRALGSGRLRQVGNRPVLFANPAGGAVDTARLWRLIVEVPLVVEETLVGILSLATDTPGKFTVEHEHIAREVAAHLAVALRQARLFVEVGTGHDQLRALSSRLVEVQEAERRFLAHELHDEIGQVLTGLKLTLEMSAPAAGPQNPALAEAIAMVDDLMQRVRQLSLDLRPQMLDDLGLLPALDWLFARCAKQTGLRVRFKHTSLTKRLPAQLETAVFRIVQEALTNVVRHAGASQTTVLLWQDSRNQILGVQVHDSGAGFDVPRALSARTSSGLTGMRERATLLGGRFTLDSAPGTGTCLTVELPLAAAAPETPAPARNPP